jgi:hypothetical protein
MRKREVGGRTEGDPLEKATIARKTSQARTVVRSVAQKTGLGGIRLIPITYRETPKPTRQFSTLAVLP